MTPVRMRFSASQEQECFFAVFCVVFISLDFFVYDFSLLVGWLFFCSFVFPQSSQSFISYFFLFPPKEFPTSKMCWLGPSINVRQTADIPKASCVSCVLVIEHHLEVFTLQLQKHSFFNIFHLGNSISLVLGYGSKSPAYRY